MVIPIVELFILALFIIVQIVISPQFGPTWDFAFHLQEGLTRLGEATLPPGLDHLLYGIFTDVPPLLFSRIFPATWFPASYFLYTVIIGCCGAIFFYLLVKEQWGKNAGLIAFCTLFCFPRFIGHLHTNNKDISVMVFFIAASYFLARYIKTKKPWSVFWYFFFIVLSINTKIASILNMPIFGCWLVFTYFISKNSRSNEPIWYRLLIMANLLIGPLIISFLVWFSYWPSTVSEFVFLLTGQQDTIAVLHPPELFYALRQIIETSPIPLLLGALLGTWVLIQEVTIKKQSIAFFFLFLLLFSWLKFTVLGIPVIDDTRYFLEVYYAMAIACTLGIQFMFKKFSLYAEFGTFLFCLYLMILYHPYEINYSNILANHPDGDFWAASYTEVFTYINDTAPRNAIISSRLAPELSGYLLRSDLKRGLNTKTPEESDIVIILNRASVFNLFQVTDFMSTHKPAKIFAMKNTIPLTYIYFPK